MNVQCKMSTVFTFSIYGKRLKRGRNCTGVMKALLFL